MLFILRIDLNYHLHHLLYALRTSFNISCIVGLLTISYFNISLSENVFILTSFFKKLCVRAGAESKRQQPGWKDVRRAALGTAALMKNPEECVKEKDDICARQTR